jgi:hypothetical protein
MVYYFTTNHGSQYGKQIAFVDNDDLYIRRLTGSTLQNGGRLFIQVT